MSAHVAFFEAFLEEEGYIRDLLPEAISPIFFRDTIQESNQTYPPAPFISVRTQSIIPKEWHDNIDAVLTRSQGYDHIHRMFTNCVKLPALGYLGPYCSSAVAEHAFMLMLMLLKKAKLQMQQFTHFNRDGLTGREVSRRKALIFGVGNIGSELARLCLAWNMEVKGVDIEPKNNSIDYVNLDDGLPWADVIFCAAPLTSLTKEALGYDKLKIAASDAVFINISRGEISPQQDLAKLMDEQLLAGVGLDVYSDEKNVGEKLRQAEQSDPQVVLIKQLAENPNVICTPHNAFNSMEALQGKVQRTIESVTGYFEGGRFPHTILALTN